MSRVPFRSASLVTSHRPPPTPGLPTLQTLHGGLPLPQGRPCAREWFPREQERVCPGPRALHSRSLGVCIRHRVISDHCPSSSQGHPACPHLASGLSGVGEGTAFLQAPGLPGPCSTSFPESSQASPPHLPPAEPGRAGRSPFSAATEHSRLSWPGSESGWGGTELAAQHRPPCPQPTSPCPPGQGAICCQKHGRQLGPCKQGREEGLL